MKQIIDLLTIFLPLMYAGVFFTYLTNFLYEWPRARQLSSPLLLLALLTHLAYLLLIGVTYRHHPMAGGYEFLCNIAFALAFTYLTIERWRRNRSTGVFVLPFVLILQTVASFGIAPSSDIPPILRNFLFGVHTGAATLGYAGFFLSTVYAGMYFAFHRALRKKNFGLMFERLPSLDILMKMTYSAAFFGFLFLSAAIITGLGWASRTIPGEYWLDAKVLCTIGLWAIYGLILASRYLFGVRGRLLVGFLLLGFILFLTATAVVNLFLSHWHRFGVH